MTSVLLNDDALLRSLYPAELFDAELIRGLGLIPTEYLYFSYNGAQQFANQLAAGGTRGRPHAMNNSVLEQMASLRHHRRCKRLSKLPQSPQCKLSPA